MRLQRLGNADQEVADNLGVRDLYVDSLAVVFDADIIGWVYRHFCITSVVLAIVPCGVPDVRISIDKNVVFIKYAPSCCSLSGYWSSQLQIRKLPERYVI